jgi:hypothetical protein
LQDRAVRVRHLGPEWPDCYVIVDGKAAVNHGDGPFDDCHVTSLSRGSDEDCDAVGIDHLRSVLVAARRKTKGQQSEGR